MKISLASSVVAIFTLGFVALSGHSRAENVILDDPFLSKPVTVLELFLQNLEARAKVVADEMTSAMVRDRWSDKWRPTSTKTVLAGVYFDKQKQEIITNFEYWIEGVDDPWMDICRQEVDMKAHQLNLRKEFDYFFAKPLLGGARIVERESAQATMRNLLDHSIVQINFIKVAKNERFGCRRNVGTEHLQKVMYERAEGGELKAIYQDQ